MTSRDHDEDTRLGAMQLVCPTCYARAGAECENPKGERMMGLHSSRILKFCSGNPEPLFVCVGRLGCRNVLKTPNTLCESCKTYDPKCGRCCHGLSWHKVEVGERGSVSTTACGCDCDCPAFVADPIEHLETGGTIEVPAYACLGGLKDCQNVHAGPSGPCKTCTQVLGQAQHQEALALVREFRHALSRNLPRERDLPDRLRWASLIARIDKLLGPVGLKQNILTTTLAEDLAKKTLEQARTEIFDNSGPHCSFHGAPAVGDGFECGCDKGRIPQLLEERAALAALVHWWHDFWDANDTRGSEYDEACKSLARTARALWKEKRR